mmetsp:Transcript_50370/g.96202  ORF Transcript_50370/g.96202 Transcript_50370/m.96202 type:complete len:482 (-) Transcript_50370:638-2083(-)
MLGYPIRLQICAVSKNLPRSNACISRSASAIRFAQVGRHNRTDKQLHAHITIHRARVVTTYAGSGDNPTRLAMLLEELDQVAQSARNAALKGASWAELGAGLKRKAAECAEAGNEVGAEAALAELAEAQQQVAQAEEKMKAFKELARKLEEAIQAEDRGGGAQETGVGGSTSDQFQYRPTPSLTPTPKAVPAGLTNEQVEDRFRSIELRTLEAMLEQQAPPRPPALEPKSNDASEANELGVFAEQSEASGSEESSDKQPASDPTVPFWWSPPAARQEEASDGAANAQSEIRAWMAKIDSYRMKGRDVAVADLMELRRICQESGSTAAGCEELKGGIRESLFRTAVGAAIEASASEQLNQFRGDSPSGFVCALAHDLGLQQDRAIVIVSSTVAADARSKLISMVAQLRMGSDKEMAEDMRKLLNIFENFPPMPGSAEMELLASGLDSLIPNAEKIQLLNLARRKGGTCAAEGVAQALGLSVL